MVVCIAGKNNIAVDVCSYLLEKRLDCSVWIVLNKTDLGINGFQRSLKKFAEDNHLRIVRIEDVYDIPNLVFLSLEFDRIILPSRFLSNNLFNIHFSLLPEYKGMYTSALPILHMKQYTGVTLHKIDSGIDTGDIIEQRKITLSPVDTAKTLYLKYMKEGTSVVIENIELILNNGYTAKAQASDQSSYYSKSTLNYSDLQLCLNVTACQLESQIRAFNFRNYQLPKLYGYNIIGATITKERSVLKAGQIVEDNENYISLATIDYNIRAYKDRFLEVLECCKIDNSSYLQLFPQLNFYLNESEQVHGWTPLMVAAYNNSISVCEYLIEQGADVNAQNFNGTTVIMYAKDAACKAENNYLIDLLLKNGANPFLADFSGRNLFDYLKEESVVLLDYIKEKWLNS